MERECVVRLLARFEEIVQVAPSGVEFWCARDLQSLLGYAEWRNFAKVIDKAITACENAGYEPKDHFAAINKMVDLGSGAKREINDIALNRYACYLITINGDPSKEPIAFAQTYFAVQTRKQEIIEKRLADAVRLSARRKLSQSEKELSGIIFEKLGEGESFARIRSKGDAALFGGAEYATNENEAECPRRKSFGRLPSNHHDQGKGFRERNYQLQHQAAVPWDGRRYHL